VGAGLAGAAGEGLGSVTGGLFRVVPDAEVVFLPNGTTSGAVAEVFRAGRRKEVIALGPRIVDRSVDFATGTAVGDGAAAAVEARGGAGSGAAAGSGA
jgi:hypothetical protein